jgi:hypothetical protein|tara:strand:+ start:1761 stop:2528 length:768 start_codon:yes stop_codon:yes gene_type:complete
MSKKTILNETQIRRFMKLADMTPLSEPFVRGSAYTLSEQMPPDLEPAEEDDPMAAMPGEVEEPMDLGAPEEGPGAGGVDIESLVSAIADAIEQETGVEVSVEGDGGGEEAVDDLAGMDDMAGPEEMGDMGDMGNAGEMGDESMMEQKLRSYIRKQVAGMLMEKQDEDEEDEDVQEEGHKHMDGGQDMLTKGTNSNRDFEKDDNRQSSAGEKHTGGGKAKTSKTHMGGNSAALPLEEAALERLTSRVAARLLDKRR